MTSGATGTPAAVASPARAEGFSGDWRRGEPAALAFLPRHPAREGDWEERIAECLRVEPAAAVWERAAADGQRLGADDAARDAARALARGGCLCVTTGQQPGLFLGPLYTVYKAMTAVALARRVERRNGTRTVPVFWNAADDSDFGEIGRAILPDEDFRLGRYALDGGELPAGGMVGGLGVDGTRAALEEARAAMSARPSGERLLAHLERALARAHDHGELATALLHDLFRGTGLVVVDGRWPELRRAASPLLARYAGLRDEVRRAVVDTGRRLEEAGWRAPISKASAEHALFALADGRRLPFPGDDAALAERARSDPESLSPNVLLRPAVQDSLFPNVATVGGPGEISYHAQLADEYALLDVAMPVLVPRFEATLVPEGVFALAERRGAPVERFVADFDAALKATADAALPAPLREALADARRALGETGGRVRGAAESFETRLAGAADEFVRRAGDALDRLEEKAAQAARAAEARRDPRVKAYREFLRPRGVPQERVVSALTLFLESEAHPLECLEAPLEDHLEAARDGRPVHWLLPFGGCREERA